MKLFINDNIMMGNKNTKRYELSKVVLLRVNTRISQQKVNDFNYICIICSLIKYVFKIRIVFVVHIVHYDVKRDLKSYFQL